MGTLQAGTSDFTPHGFDMKMLFVHGKTWISLQKAFGFGAVSVPLCSAAAPHQASLRTAPSFPAAAFGVCPAVWKAEEPPAPPD